MPSFKGIETLPIDYCCPPRVDRCGPGTGHPRKRIRRGSAIGCRTEEIVPRRDRHKRTTGAKHGRVLLARWDLAKATVLTKRKLLMVIKPSGGWPALTKSALAATAQFPLPRQGDREPRPEGLDDYRARLQSARGGFARHQRSQSPPPCLDWRRRTVILLLSLACVLMASKSGRGSHA